jgi:hypothetical protein
MFESLVFAIVSVAVVLIMAIWIVLSRGKPKKLVIALVICVLYWLATYAVAQMLYIQPFTVGYVNTTTIITQRTRSIITVTTTITTNGEEIPTQTVTTSTATRILTAYVSLPITIYTTNPEAESILSVGMWATIILLTIVLFYSFLVLSRKLRV